MNKAVFLAVLLVVPVVVDAGSQDCKITGDKNVCGNNVKRDLITNHNNSLAAKAEHDVYITNVYSENIRNPFEESKETSKQILARVDILAKRIDDLFVKVDSLTSQEISDAQVVNYLKQHNLKAIPLQSVKASNIEIHETHGDKSSALVQDNTVKGNITVNHGISDVAVRMIVAKFTEQHKLDESQIKSLTEAVTALSQGKVGTEIEVKAAMSALEQGNVNLAEKLFKQSVEKYEKEKGTSIKQAAEAYRNLGALAFLTDTQKSLQAYRRATELDEDNADGWNQLGRLLQRIGKLDEAISLYQNILELGQKHQNQKEKVWAYSNLGNIYKTRGELDKSIEMQEKALIIDQSLGDKEGIAQDYDNLGVIYQMRGELNKSLDLHQKALLINESIGNKERLAQNYNNLGSLYYTQGELDKAIDFQQKALQISEALGNKENSAVSLGSLGNVYQIRGELDKALQIYQKSLQIFQTLGSKEGTANIYSNLGSVYKQQNNNVEAKRHYQKAIELYKYIGSPNAEKVQKWLDKLK